MTIDTINNAVTMPGNGGNALLAGRYRTVKQLGQGGMGSVWLVEDTQLDNRPFAVKMLPSILVSNKRAYRQLKDEALVAMKLTHPNIVTLRAFEENGGNPFLVMDYVDGQTLDDYLAEQCGTTGTTGTSPVTPGIPEADVIRILRPIAAALDYAHEQGVVHRDVKPANVLIRKDGHPFILDFGIAREVQETMTRMTGALSSGTLPYMSPEQLRGARPAASQDVYSFAVMAYECLAGEPPFARGQIEFQILNEKPAPLLGGTQLAASVMSGLAKEPEGRPTTCTAVLGDAMPERMEPRQTVTVPQPSPVPIPTPAETQRHPVVVNPPSTWDVPVSDHKIKFLWDKKKRWVIPILFATLGVVGSLLSIWARGKEILPITAISSVVGIYGLGFSLAFYHMARKTHKTLQLFGAKNWYSAMQRLRQRLGPLEWVPRHKDPLVVFFQGVCFLEGLGGCKKNLLRARNLFTRSTERGLTESLCALGYMSQCGLGEAVDIAKARNYYSEAKNQGSKLAEKLLEGLPQQP